MTAERPPGGLRGIGSRVLERSGRWSLPVGIAGLLCAAGALAAGSGWPVVTAAVGGLTGGAGLALAGLRRAAAGQRDELVRLGELVDRRAEQVTALSHELRTPLSMIKGAVDLLVEGTPGPLTPAQERFLTVVERQCGHVIDLCESLLIQAKIEAGLFTPRLEQVDVSVVARDVVTAMRPLCAERGQRVTLDTPQVTPRIPADPMLLAQALTNLLSNASRFTSAGGAIDVLAGGDRGRALGYLRRLHPNVLQYSKSGAAPAQQAARGEVGVGIVFAHDCVATREQGFPLTVTFPSEGTGYEVGGVAVVAGARNPAGAKRYVDWALTPAAQQVGPAARSYQAPTHPDARPSDKTVDLGAVRLVDYDSVAAGTAKAELTRLFDEEIARAPKA